MKACPKEEESQKSSTRLGLWGSKECQDLGMELFHSGDPPERKKKKVSSGSIPHECCIIYQGQPG